MIITRPPVEEEEEEEGAEHVKPRPSFGASEQPVSAEHIMNPRSSTRTAWRKRSNSR